MKVFAWGVKILDVTTEENDLLEAPIRIAIQEVRTELECAHMSPAQARRLAALLEAAADAIDGGESSELVTVIPGFTLNLSKETTQGTAPPISAICASASHVECTGCACPCHNPPALPRRDPDDTFDYLADMRRFLDDARKANDKLDPTDTIIAWLVAEAAVEGINPQDVAREWLAEEPPYAEELERRSWDDNDEWPAWPFERNDDEDPPFDAPRFIPGGDNRYND